jgi:hypothetical protein
MKLRCPACGAVFSLELVLAHEGAREALALAFDIAPELGRELLKYLALHRPAQRELTMDRVAALLGELLPQIKAAQVTRNGTIRAAPLTLWLKALEAIQEQRRAHKLDLPLKGHGLLLEIVSRLALAATGQQERAEEEAKQYRYIRQGSGLQHAAQHAPSPRPSPAEGEGGKEGAKKSKPPEGWAGSSKSK